MKRLLGLTSSCLLVLAAGCGDDDRGIDAGPRLDVGAPGDAGRVDSGRDAGPGFDAGPGIDAAPGGDAGFDAGFDAAPRVDAAPGLDAGMDAALGRDAGTDAGSICGDFGEPCISACRRSAFCQTPLTVDLAGSETVTNLPPGTDTTVVYFEGGYCTPDDFSGDSLNFCDPDDPTDTTCGDCGVCVSLGVDTMCLRRCAPTNDDNSDCRDGYECDLGTEACFPGCQSDVECRIYRQETNRIPGLQTPDACAADPAVCGGSATNYDRLVYDTTGRASCNPDTARCEFLGRPGAEAGVPCTRDIDCETDGFCITDAAWAGGYCSKLRCDLDGRACAGDGKCQERGFGVALCADGCTVGAGAGVDPMDESTWLVAEGGCRAGYTCFWDGVGGAGVADNGACLPGVFNDVTTPNVGGPCDSDADCWSPFGRGFCLEATDAAGNPTGFAGGYCAIRDCMAPGLPAGICGDGGACVGGFDASDPTFALCLDACTTPEDCRDGYGCVELAGTRACFLGCNGDTDCKATQRCDIPPGAVAGTCVDR